jgi:hypothetical protein
MAEERTLGLARAQEDFAEELSKEELQRRLDVTRDSISHTVSEIKETVANQVQAVKETLDWREQFKKRPVAWSVGAAGLGFCVGYCVAATIKGDERDDYNTIDYYAPQQRTYAAQPIISSASSRTESARAKEQGNGHDEGPGFLEKLSHTTAYGRVRDEVGNVGDAFIQELGKTAKQLVLPALIKSLKDFIGGYLPSSSEVDSSRPASMTNESSRAKSQSASGYQPTLERGQS